MDVERFRRAFTQEQLSHEGIVDASGSSTVLTGELLLRGAGEQLVDVVFPTPFTSKPIMSFGGEIQDTNLLVAGKYPTISVIVAGWITKEVPPYSVLFTGAKLCIVTTGLNIQKMIVYWSFTGSSINTFGE
jgi:hypothetical protein